jgi:hypothetical protein
MMRSVRVALAAGLALTALAIAVTLSQSPLGVAATNSIQGKEELATLHRGTALCQSGEAIPRGTSAIRLGIFAFLGPKVTLTAYAGDRVITEGTRGSGWTGWVVTVPVKPVSHAVSDVKLCFAVHLARDETVKIIGAHQSARSAYHPNGKPLGGRVTVEYMQSGRRSWWSLASLVARHMSFGHADSGPWSVFVVIALAAAIAAAASRIVLRELR